MILLLHTRKFQIKKWLFWGGFVDCYVLLTIGLSVRNFLGGQNIDNGDYGGDVNGNGDNEIADDDGGGDVNGNLTCG